MKADCELPGTQKQILFMLIMLEYMQGMLLYFLSLPLVLLSLVLL
jgi:hypothetical protein